MLLVAAAVGLAARAANHTDGPGGLVITGSADVPLSPGTSQPLDLRLQNRYRFDVRLTQVRIKVSINQPHRRAGCSSRDFRVRQLPHSVYPLRLARRSATTLSWLGVRTLPVLAMRNRPHWNQDGCKGATVNLAYAIS